MGSSEQGNQEETHSSARCPEDTRSGVHPLQRFAQKPGRLSRTYADMFLRMAAEDLIDLYEAKSLDGGKLRAIAAILYGVNVSPRLPPV